ncbi:hypothetical protein BDV93DRAFT_176246 [Ceratobasidium sp. AG-I]|nr:hypothetical protein BDV93DRAFT_176246 [Ceratobasidium sp. AG-I]
MLPYQYTLNGTRARRAFKVNRHLTSSPRRTFLNVRLPNVFAKTIYRWTCEMSSRLPFFRSRQIPVKGLIAFAIQTMELGRSSSPDFATRLACLSTLALAPRIPRSTTSSTPVEPPLAPSSFPRPRPLLPTIILGSCLQPSNRRRGVHTLILIISFLVFIQPSHSESLHRHLPTTHLCIRITLSLPTLRSTCPANMAYLIQSPYRVHHTSGAARIPFVLAFTDISGSSTPCLDTPRPVGTHRRSLLLVD